MTYKKYPALFHIKFPMYILNNTREHTLAQWTEFLNRLDIKILFNSCYCHLWEGGRGEGISSWCWRGGSPVLDNYNIKWEKLNSLILNVLGITDNMFGKHLHLRSTNWNLHCIYTICLTHKKCCFKNWSYWPCPVCNVLLPCTLSAQHLTRPNSVWIRVTLSAFYPVTRHFTSHYT